MIYHGLKLVIGGELLNVSVAQSITETTRSATVAHVRNQEGAMKAIESSESLTAEERSAPRDILRAEVEGPKEEKRQTDLFGSAQ